MAPQVFWIGLGNMGRGMCKNIVAKGPLDKPLLLFNRTHAVATELARALGGPDKAQAVESIAAGAAQADVIFISLTNDEIMSAMVGDLLKVEGIAGKLLVDTTTVHPDTADSVAAKVTAAGAAYVSSPVMGAPEVAEAGQLVGLVAGEAAAVDRARPYLTGVTCRALIDMAGAPCARALTLKIIGNTMVFNMIEQLAEAHVLAEKIGLGTGPLHQFLETVYPVYAKYSARMITGDYHTRNYPLFAVDLARKDADIALKLAATAGTRLANVETADAHLAKLKDIAGERGDVAGIYGVVRTEAGLDYKVKKD